MSNTAKTIIWVCIFSIAMAALESAVVVYLRALFYPDGFTVAFRLIDERILRVELLRELATLVMLIALGYIAGKTFAHRLAYFLLAFAIWDIFYYAWLKVLIDWPATFSDWDILFLIPFTWLGPVWAPLVCSLTMIVQAFVLLTSRRPVGKIIWTFLISGSVLILFTFMVDYGTMIVENGFAQDFPNLLQNPEFLSLASQLSPQPFSWIIFCMGEAILAAGIYFQYRGFGSLKELFRSPGVVSP